MTSSTSWSRAVPLALLLTGVALVGCAGKTVGGDLLGDDGTRADAGGGGGGGGGGDGKVICGPSKGCDEGDIQADSSEACAALGVEYCYSRIATCGTDSKTFWCGHPYEAQCTAMPACNPGDREVPVCPSLKGTTCYTRSACGSTITCQHTEACTERPACDAGDEEVKDTSTCSVPGAKCYSRTECGFTVWCVDRPTLPPPPPG